MTRDDSASEAGRVDKAYYDSSSYFDRDTGHLTDLDSPFQRYRVSKVLEIQMPEPEARVADLGCGWGTFEWVLAPRVREIVGVDFSETSIRLCRERLAREGHENVRFLEADAGDTGLDAGGFHAVLCADLFEHLYPEDSDRVAAEAFRILRPGGWFSVWTPHRGHILEILKNNHIVLEPDPTHVDYKSMERMTRVVRSAGFTVERAYYAESHLPVLRTVERALMGVVPFLRRRIAVLGRKPE